MIEVIYRGGFTLEQRGTFPQIYLLPPDSKASWPFWRDFWDPKMLQNPNFDPAGGAYSAPPDPLTDGEGSLPPPKNPYPALGPSGLVSTGLRV